jgi:mannose-6-phosphate isomerase-like protein (cupin superfamily)/CTP:molybdopterin cytidylyltransferase MocA
MTNLIQPVILCCGSGTRLWPLSRAGFPKQFLSLTGNESMSQQAAHRLVALKKSDIDVAKLIIVTGEEHRFLATEQLREADIELGCALLERVSRNTAPALTLAALAAQENALDPILVVTPADQTLADSAAFTQAMHQAVAQAAEGAIVILGITPDRPETGYGYIPTQANTDQSFKLVQRFVEKPDALPVADKSRSQEVKHTHVKLGASLSLQKHQHRAEHRIVVKDMAEIINGEKSLVLTEDQSTYIHSCELHRLSNLDNIPLEIIEVQSGHYLGEDDIVRFDDLYGRTNP